MPSWRKSWKQWLAALAVLMLLVLFGVTAVRTAADTPGGVLAERVLADLLRPLHSMTRLVTRGVQGVSREVQDLFTLREENRRLRAEVDRLRPLAPDNDALRRENESLREQLALGERHPYELLAAEVIGRYPGTWFQTLVIDRGARDGVRRDMAVITGEGLIGRIVRVSQRTAQVQLLLEPSSAVGALNLSNGEAGTLVSEAEGRLRLTFFNFDAAVREGDKVVTSGLGVSIPAGLYIGTVAAVGRDPDTMLPYGVVTPAADFARIEHVMVVLSEPEEHFEQPAGEREAP